MREHPASRLRIRRAIGHAALALAWLTLCCSSTNAQQQPPDESGLIDGVLSYLGFSPQHRRTMLDGGVVHSGMDRLEKLDEEVAVAGVVMLVKRKSAPAVIGQFLDTEVFKQVHDLTRYDPIALADHALPPDSLFAELQLGAGAHVRRIVNEPRAELNLGADDTQPFAGIAAHGPDARAALSTALRRVMANRLADYAGRGLAGVGDYVRPNGKRASAAKELRSAIESLAVFEPAFGPFIAKLGTPVRLEDELDGSRQLLWIETTVSGSPVWGLLDQQRSQSADAGIAAELHFYASSMYNSMLTLVAALPYREQTFVFALNLVYTEQVTGFGAGLKRKIARNMAANALAQHLERVRQRVETEP